MRLSTIILFFTIIYNSSLQSAQVPYYLVTTTVSNLQPIKISASLEKKHTQKNMLTGIPIILKTADNITINALFFDRNADKALVLGHAFPSSKESMLAFVDLFSNYDVIIFDYRWDNLTRFLFWPSSIVRPIKRLLYEEYAEVTAAVQFLQSHKKYKEIIGLGECYSTFTLVMAQVEAQKQNKQLFTKLILDSTWFSFYKFVQTITLDPCLPLRPQEGGCPQRIKSILRSRMVRVPVRTLAWFVTPQVTLQQYLNQLRNTPVLFIHGINDLMVPLEHFDAIWRATAHTPKVALITPYRHCDNLHDKEIYKFVCDQFINNNRKVFIQNLLYENTTRAI